MKRYIQAVALFLCAVGLSACGSFARYPTIEAGTPSAELHINRAPSEEGMLFKPPHWYFSYDNKDCNLSDRSGLLSIIAADAEDRSVVSVFAGKPVFIRAVARFNTTQGLDLYLNHCTNLLSFTPIPGAKYDLVQNILGESCAVSVVDRSTRTPPPDLQVEEVLGRCAQFNGVNDD